MTPGFGALRQRPLPAGRRIEIVHMQMRQMPCQPAQISAAVRDGPSYRRLPVSPHSCRTNLFQQLHGRSGGISQGIDATFQGHHQTRSARQGANPAQIAGNQGAIFRRGRCRTPDSGPDPDHGRAQRLRRGQNG